VFRYRLAPARMNRAWLCQARARGNEVRFVKHRHPRRSSMTRVLQAFLRFSLTPNSGECDARAYEIRAKLDKRERCAESPQHKSSSIRPSIMRKQVFHRYVSSIDNFRSSFCCDFRERERERERERADFGDVAFNFRISVLGEC